VIVRELGGNFFPDDEWPGPHLVVAAFDPGVSTGWSMISYPFTAMQERGVGSTLPGCEWQHGEIVRDHTRPGSGEHSDSRHVDDILDQGREMYEKNVDAERGDIFVQVMESFQLRMLSMDESLLAPVRVISVWKDRLRYADVLRFYQTPSDAKKAVTNERLKNWGLYDAGSGEHARDADRHNVLFARRFMSNPTRRLGIYTRLDEETREIWEGHDDASEG
jgi:hypothetical protein